MAEFIEHFETLAPRYDVVLCDVWGVVHNSLVASPQAHDALSRFRTQGGAVMLITNAPRPARQVAQQLDRLGVPHTAYDGILSSGELTRGLVEREPGNRVLHIGPERDLPLFEGLGVTFVQEADADYIACTGLFHDDDEKPGDYRPQFERMVARNLPMLCANPDLVVERGTQLIFCAGALAELYEKIGGKVVYAGKPHAPIYEEALARAATARGKVAARDRVIAIGDSLRTDIKGANNFGIASLFVTDGIHAEELGTRDRPTPAALTAAFASSGVSPAMVTNRLAW